MVLRRTSTFQLILTFFGLTSNNVSSFRLSVFNQIHEIVFHGKGGYDYNTIYNMPIWLREYTFHKLKDFYNQENKNPNEDSWVQGNVKEEASKNKKIQIPTYITKASKK
jgi:hypothetical protein